MAKPFNPSQIIGGLEFRVTGRRNLQVSLRRYGEDTGRQLKKETARHLMFVSRLAQVKVPVRTGRLRASIKRTPIIATKAHNIIGSVLASAPYAAWVEFGAGRGRGAKRNYRRRVAYAIARAPGKRYGSVSEAVEKGALARYRHPYLGPALEKVRPMYYQACINVLVSEAQRIQSRGRKVAV